MKLRFSCILLLAFNALASSIPTDTIVTMQEGVQYAHGAIIRFSVKERVIHLVFTGHEFADGGEIIRNALKKHGAKASFFFTGDFLRREEFAPLVHQLRDDGHYIGGHSDKHLLYAAWENRDSLLVSKDSFMIDVQANYEALRAFGITRENAPYFLPPYEWYNQAIADWCGELGLTLVNFTPGTSSNADYTIPSMRNYLTSDTIYHRILRYESTTPHGLNGFLLLMRIGSHPERTDKFYHKLDMLLEEQRQRGYRFGRLRR